jgi:hypothetical protein
MDAISRLSCDVLLEGSGVGGRRERLIARRRLSVAASKVITAAAFGLIVASDLEAQAAAATIVETDGRQARATSQVRVQSQPELQIGAADGNPAYMFSYISGVALLPGERILVVDAGSAELRFYDLEGRFLSRRGRRGEGPGEFYEPRLLNTVAGDSIVNYDSRYRRFTLFSSDGEGFRTFSSPAGTGGRNGMSASTGKVLNVAGNMGVPIRPGMHGLLPSTVVARIMDVTRETADTIAEASYTQVAISSPGRPSSFSSAPYSRTLAVAADRDRFFIASPNEPSVREYVWTGEHRRTFRLLESVNRVTDAEWSAAIKREVAERINTPPGTIRDVYRGLEPPDVEPTFQRLIVDNEGWLWAQAYDVSSNDGVSWLLFDATGRGRGTVTMPEGLSVNAISRGYVAGVWRDDLDVEHVRLHRITGRS